MSLAIRAAEHGLVPDVIVRAGIRRLLRQRLREAAAPGATQAFIDGLVAAPIALVPEKANGQHYEVSTEFFERVLGPWRKYSCGWWEPGAASLAQSEEAMLRLTCERAGVADGMDVLDLGCGWGAASLWMAEHYPQARILGVSNSATQHAAILQYARRLKLSNIRIDTADVNTYDPGRTFDRIVSVEMLEHVRNLPQLLDRVCSWLRPGGQFFVHIFCHDRFAYPYEVHGKNDWMAKHFFSGGMMPSYDLLPRVAPGLRLIERWRVPGTHYAYTCRAWLHNLDDQREAIHDYFVATYGSDEANRWIQRWRLFFMSCEELFAFRAGKEWFVGHYLFERPS